jgi:hypothetical protein
VSASARSCVDCASSDADLPIVLETGVFEGWICRDCDRIRRRRHAGWKGRIRKRVRRYVG